MFKTPGIDISIWQDDNSTAQTFDFHKAKAAGAKFVFIKSSQQCYLDQDYVLNWLNSEGVLPRGAYHFLDWRENLDKQIQFFSTIINNDPGELPPVLDFEMKTNAPTKTVAAAACLKFLKQVEQNTGISPILYTSPGYWYSYGSYTVQEFKKYLLWIAHYGVANPSVFLPWTKWTFWQYGVFPNGKMFGAESTNLDHNWFNGTEEELRIFAGIQEVGPTTEERLTRLETMAHVHNN